MCCPKCVRLTLPSSFEEDKEKRVDAGFRAEKKSDMMISIAGVATEDHYLPIRSHVLKAARRGIRSFVSWSAKKKKGQKWNGHIRRRRSPRGTSGREQAFQNSADDERRSQKWRK